MTYIKSNVVQRVGECTSIPKKSLTAHNDF